MAPTRIATDRSTLSRPKKRIGSTPGGAPRTTCRSGKSTCSTIRCSKEPLERNDIKPRLLGHWGTTPGLNFVYVHLNRAIKARDLDMMYMCRPGPRRARHCCQYLARRHLQRDLSEHLPQNARGMQRLFQAIQLSRRHPEPCRARDAGLDPRGRRARLCAVARLRRGVRQSGSDRRLRGRRRRGGNRADGDLLALQQIS